jgi:hypothetical protein
MKSKLASRIKSYPFRIGFIAFLMVLMMVILILIL